LALEQLLLTQLLSSKNPTTDNMIIVTPSNVGSHKLKDNKLDVFPNALFTGPPSANGAGSVILKKSAHTLSNAMIWKHEIMNKMEFFLLAVLIWRKAYPYNL
jgi:hypothetical protein